MKKNNMIFVGMCVTAVVLALWWTLGGCAVSEEVAALRKDIASQKAQLATMPSGQARDYAIKNLDKAENALTSLEQYATVAVGLGGIAFGVYNRIKKRVSDAHLEKVVASVEAAFPDKTQDEKNKLALAQGPETTKVVERLKNGK